MLPALRRLKKSDFPLFLKGFKPLDSQYFYIKARKNNSGLSRFAVIVPVSVSKKAHSRNKIKRRVRYAIHKKLNCVEENYYTAIYVKKNILGVKYGEIETDLIKTLKKGKILK